VAFRAQTLPRVIFRTRLAETLIGTSCGVQDRVTNLVNQLLFIVYR
jgi:hypothetical protein